MKNRRIGERRGSRNASRLRRIRTRYMRRRHRKTARARRLAFLFCSALAAGYLLMLAEHGGRLVEIEGEKKTEEQAAWEQEAGKRRFGIIFRLEDGEITIYQESFY